MGSLTVAGCFYVLISLSFVIWGADAGEQYENCTDRVDGVVNWIRDGWCDEINNHPACSYDGGDCCECTAGGSSLEYYFAGMTFFCLDPHSGCVDPLVDMYPNCTNGDLRDIGDGNCEVENNNEGCHYDGGDCCECTRGDDNSSLPDNTSSLFSLCVNPNASCYDPAAVALQSSCTDGTIASIGNGWCDIENNNKECLYDGGDCCECTRTNIGTSSGSISSFSVCVDPSAPCYDYSAVILMSNCTYWTIEDVGNGRCDLENNNEGCLYDRGDCCECTRINDGTLSYSDTSSSFSFCLDANASCYDPAVVPLESSCTSGSIGYVRDGKCDVENNNKGCLYDGGDCCPCSCNHGFYGCGYEEFVCSDPTAANLEQYICVESPPTRTSCPDNLQREWVVENASQVRALGRALRCSGSFNVMWKGMITIDETLSIFDGTALTVTSAGPDAIIDGGGKIRLLEVVNASLCLRNVTVSGGRAKYGGAIAASRSRLTFNQVTFSGNTAFSGGGALLFSEGSVASFGGVTSFLNNTAFDGGVIYMTSDSNASWLGESSFSENSATWKGGALYVANGSSVIFTAAQQFLVNDALYGGALYVTEGSTVVWTATSKFVANHAFDGGALYLESGSNATWNAASQFFANDAKDGGALYVASGSSAVWTAASQFLTNIAESEGGALVVAGGSSAAWTAPSQFVANSATLEGGGALRVETSSKVSWAAETIFMDNIANSTSGGGLYITDTSHAIWTAESHFVSNSAGSRGGALYISNGSATVWTATSFFHANNADHDGGALCVVGGSSATWKAALIFSSNSAQSDGGAVYLENNGFLSWEFSALFANNNAQNGGALYLTNGVKIEWSGETNFTSNNARLNGGAVGSRALGSDLFSLPGGAIRVVNDKTSVMTINGTTRFMKNTCGASGGGMALVQSLVVLFGNYETTFWRNSAHVSGGAVFIAGTRIGTVFRGVGFVGNFAQTGGGVHATGSGTAVTVGENNEHKLNPTTFYGCSFLVNYAFATGGAVDSASGQNIFSRTSFEGNKARLGGALRLAGAASIENCSFIENISELGGGPAVSNAGYMSNVSSCYFRDNVFSCEPQTFLDFNSNDLLETICKGCPDICAGCSFEESRGTPTCTSLEKAGVEHATSEGGTTTIEELIVYQGYWRATNTSKNVYKCFNPKACVGGLTDASNFCFPGYEGPYCSVCSKSYASSSRFTCQECSDHLVDIAVITALAVLVSAVGTAVVLYLISAERVGAVRGVVDRVMQRVPMQSVKIVIVVWQILTQFASVTNVAFPEVYQTLLHIVDYLNFDLGWIVSTGCLVEIDFHDRLLWTTIAPVVIMVFLAGTYAVAVRNNRGSSDTALSSAWHKHVSMALLVTFLVYSSVSTVVFQMFTCDDFEDGSRYLRADYTINCESSKHRALQIYAGFMIFLYPVGIPVFYAGLLLSIRRVLQGTIGWEESPLAKSTSDLWKPYKPQRFYYEIVECFRRILLTGAIVFIYPNTAAQIASTLAIAVVFVFVSEATSPYQSLWDAWISRIGHGIVFASIYWALLLKVDVSSENDFSQNAFEIILVATHGCMVLGVVVQAVVMALSFRRGVRLVNPRPR